MRLEARRVSYERPHSTSADAMSDDLSEVSLNSNIRDLLQGYAFTHLTVDHVQFSESLVSEASVCFEDLNARLKRRVFVPDFTKHIEFNTNP